ncbi:hypothetical protein HK096_004734, partial [Nowakowskiella sp. JEL0078]
MTRKFDIIVFGATGFTGELVARYLFVNYVPSGLRIAIAGRSLDKLEAVKLSLIEKYNVSESKSFDIPIIIASSSDIESLDKMVSQTKVIITTVGPFEVHGRPLANLYKVEACIRAGTHYIDSTGETTFISSIIDSYHESAVEKKVLIVPSCAYDSVPSDMGTYYLANFFREKYNLRLENVYGSLKVVGFGVSAGTAGTGLIMMEKKFTSMDPGILVRGK